MSENLLDSIANEMDGCPKCGSMQIQKVGFTWWGGIIGPRLLNHTKCKDCKFTFNAKTKASNSTAIIIYAVVTAAVAFGLMYFIMK